MLGWAIAGAWPRIDCMLIVAAAAYDGDGRAVAN
jgi:hypothetical protein